MLASLTGATFAAVTNDWFSIDNGGGTSSSTNYQISFTIGQPDAVIWSGTNADVIGGFWAIEDAAPAVIGPAPSLVVRRALPNLLISWPSSFTGYALQQNSDVANVAGWQNVGTPPQDNGTNKTVSLPAAGISTFYRLRRP